MEKTTRREMLVALGAAAGGVVLAACSGSAPAGGDDAGGGSCDVVDATIADNHGHEVTVAPEDVAAGTMKTYMLVGASHVHEVTLSAADFESLAMGQTVMELSTTVDSHDHQITFRCG